MSDGADGVLQAECPVCRTNYSLPADGIPQTGRTLQCARCSHVWHFLPPEPAPPQMGPLSGRTEIAFPESPPPPVVEPGEPGFTIWFWFFWLVAALVLAAAAILVFHQPLIEEFPKLAPVLESVLEYARRLFS